MAYRSDIAALEARLASLDAELATKKVERDETAAMLAEARDRDAYARMLAHLVARRARARVVRVIAACAALFMVVIGIGYRLSLPPRPDPVDAALVKFSQFSDEMCQCRDHACSQEVSDRMTTWGQEMAKQMPAPKLSDTQLTRAQELGTRLAECMQKLMPPPRD